jgi:hypothetical protein
MSDFKRGLVIGFKIGLTGYALLAIGLVCFTGAGLAIVLAGDVVEHTLTAIWG